MSAIEPATAVKVARLIPRLASDHEPEVVATVLAIRRVLAKCGADLHDLAAKVEGEPAERVAFRDRTVYRDTPPKSERKPHKPRKPKAQPADEAPPEPRGQDPNLDYTIGFEEVIAVGDLILSAGGLSEREEDFITSMRTHAKRRRQGFRMTVRQANWWRVIAKETGAADFRSNAA